MPRGISRFLCPVVSLAVLMPPVAAGAQEGPARSAPRRFAIAQVNGGFVIRSSDHRAAAPPSVRLGRTIRLDRTITERRPASDAASRPALAEAPGISTEEKSNDETR